MRILVIAVHPDDETLGCGGTLLYHQANGDTLYWLIATRTHQPQWSEEVTDRKTAEVELVAAAYGMEQYYTLGFPTIMLDTVPQAELIRNIRSVISGIHPEFVYLVHCGDIHTDHQAVFTATMAVLKPFYMADLGVRRILCYETLSSTESAPPYGYGKFTPNVFSDISPYIDRKIEIMELYESEMQSDPFPRGPSAIRALARHRGSTVGVEYAEAFVSIRELL